MSASRWTALTPKVGCIHSILQCFLVVLIVLGIYAKFKEINFEYFKRQIIYDLLGVESFIDFCDFTELSGARVEKLVALLLIDSISLSGEFEL